MSELEFVDELPEKAVGGRPVGSSALGRFLAALRDHPGQWAKFPDATAHNQAHRMSDIRHGRRYGVKPGEFEAAQRKIDGLHHLFVRYVGGES